MVASPHDGARSLIATLVLAAALFSPTSAVAADAEARAAALYDKGVAAQNRGDYRTAAQLFAKADEVLPEPSALEAAIKAALLADDAILGMSLVERSARAPVKGTLARAVNEAQTHFADRVAQLRVDCDGCDVRMDGSPISLGVSQWVTVGKHRLLAYRDGRVERQSVLVSAGDHTVIALDPTEIDTGPKEALVPPPGQDSATSEGSDGVAPVWLGVGVGLTIIALGATIGSGIDTLKQHDTFLADPTDARAEEGQSAEARTYVLMGLTLGLAATTTLVGVFAVDWGPDGEQGSALVTPLPGGAAASVMTTF